MSDNLSFDSNVVLHLLSKNTVKADHAEHLLQAGGVISVQVLDEVTSVLQKKLKLNWPEIAELISLIEGMCRVEV